MRKPLIILFLFSFVFAKSQVMTYYNMVSSTPPSYGCIGFDTTGMDMKCILYSDCDTLRNGSKLKEWDDLSLFHNNFIQSNATYQPTVTTGALNGYPAFKFNGSSTYMSCTTNIFKSVTAYTCFIVIKYAGSGNECAMGGNSGAEDYIVYYGTVFFAHQIFMGWGINCHNESVGADDLYSNYHTLDEIYDNSQSVCVDKIKLYDDGSIVGESNYNCFTCSSTSANTVVYLGKQLSNAAFLGGSIVAMLWSGIALSDAQRQIVETYLHTKYADY